MTENQRKALQQLLDRARAVKPMAGSMHSIHEVMADAACLIQGTPTLVQGTEGERIEWIARQLSDYAKKNR